MIHDIGGSNTNNTAYQEMINLYDKLESLAMSDTDTTTASRGELTALATQIYNVGFATAEQYNRMTRSTALSTSPPQDRTPTHDGDHQREGD